MQRTARRALTVGLIMVTSTAAGVLCRSIWRLVDKAIVNAQVTSALSDRPVLRNVVLRHTYSKLEGVEPIGGCARKDGIQIALITAINGCEACNRTLTATLAHTRARGAGTSIFVVGQVDDAVVDLATAACALGQHVEVLRIRDTSAFRIHTGISVLPTLFLSAQHQLHCVITGEADAAALGRCENSTEAVQFMRQPGAVQLGRFKTE